MSENIKSEIPKDKEEAKRLLKKQRAREYYLKNQERIKQKTKDAYNPEKHAAYIKIWQKENKEKLRIYANEYYHKTKDARKEKLKESNNNWKKNNPERIKEINKKSKQKRKETDRVQRYYYWIKNKDKLLEYQKKYREANPQLARVYRHNRNEHSIKNGGEHTADDINKLFLIQNSKCAYCKIDITNNYQIDHIMPLSRGGTNWPDNLQLTCKKCNQSKNSKTHEEYLEFLSKV